RDLYCIFFFQAEDGIRDYKVLEFRRVLFRSERGRRKRLLAQATPEAREGLPAELVLAADQFVISPAGRTEETARAHAYGDEVRKIGRASCRERGEFAVGGVSTKKKR